MNLWLIMGGFGNLSHDSQGIFVQSGQRHLTCSSRSGTDIARARCVMTPWRRLSTATPIPSWKNLSRKCRIALCIQNSKSITMSGSSISSTSFFIHIARSMMHHASGHDKNYNAHKTAGLIASQTCHVALYLLFGLFNNSLALRKWITMNWGLSKQRGGFLCYCHDYMLTSQHLLAVLLIWVRLCIHTSFLNLLGIRLQQEHTQIDIFHQALIPLNDSVEAWESQDFLIIDVLGFLINELVLWLVK